MNIRLEKVLLNKQLINFTLYLEFICIAITLRSANGEILWELQSYVIVQDNRGKSTYKIVYSYSQ